MCACVCVVGKRRARMGQVLVVSSEKWTKREAMALDASTEKWEAACGTKHLEATPRGGRGGDIGPSTKGVGKRGRGTKSFLTLVFDCSRAAKQSVSFSRAALVWASSISSACSLLTASLASSRRSLFICSCPWIAAVTSLCRASRAAISFLTSSTPACSWASDSEVACGGRDSKEERSR